MYKSFLYLVFLIVSIIIIGYSVSGNINFQSDSLIGLESYGNIVLSNEPLDYVVYMGYKSSNDGIPYNIGNVKKINSLEEGEKEIKGKYSNLKIENVSWNRFVRIYITQDNEYLWIFQKKGQYYLAYNSKLTVDEPIENGSWQNLMSGNTVNQKKLDDLILFYKHNAIN